MNTEKKKQNLRRVCTVTHNKMFLPFVCSRWIICEKGFLWSFSLIKLMLLAIFISHTVPQYIQYFLFLINWQLFCIFVIMQRSPMMAVAVWAWHFDHAARKRICDSFCHLGLQNLFYSICDISGRQQTYSIALTFLLSLEL